MKTKPILFSTAMVQAILEGRKIQTRRFIFKNEPSLNHPNIICTGFTDGKKIAHFQGKNSLTSSAGENPKYQPGDILWVRETFMEFGKAPYLYKADGISYVDPMFKWKPSIFMPKAACRIFLEVTNVRVERLQDISEADAKAEGIQFHFEEMFQEFRYRDYDKKLQAGYGDPTVDYPTWRDPISSFKSLWEHINGKESWNANPWVWVYDFKKVEKPANFG